MYQKSVLDNGLRVISSTMPHTRSVSVYLLFGTGSRHEIETQAGISHFIEHLCFKGTPKRTTAKDISEAIEGVGGILNGGTDKELTLYWCKVAQPHFQLALDVITDMVLHSRFDPADIEKERQVIIEEINMSKDTPAQQVNLLIDELLWPGHPLGRDIAGSKETMAAISREMLLDYHRKKYLPGNAVVAIAGNITHQEAVTAVSQSVAEWSNRQSHLEYSAYQEQPNPRLQVEQRDTEQAHLCLALPGLSLLHPERFALDLLNTVLGEGMSSRLFTEIRDNLGLAYSINSYTDHFLDSGSVIVYAGVEPKNLEAVIKAITRELSRLKETISDTELHKAKELAKGRMLLRMEDTRNVAGWMGGQEILMNRILSPEQVISIIDNITADKLNQLARELMVSERLRLAVVGPVTDNAPLEALLNL